MKLRLLYFDIYFKECDFQDYVFKESCCCKHFSHVTKGRIFKNLNLRRKTDRNFPGYFQKNHFRHLKFNSNSPSWLARNCCHMSAFWKTKDWSSHFWEGQTFRFCYVGVHRERRLKSTKTSISTFNLRLWPAQKPKIWSILYGKKFIWQNSVV